MWINEAGCGDGRSGYSEEGRLADWLCLIANEVVGCAKYEPLTAKMGVGGVGLRCVDYRRCAAVEVAEDVGEVVVGRGGRWRRW